MEIDYSLEKKLKRAIFKKSYYEFFKWSFNVLEPQTKLEDTFHIKYICDLLQSEVERIIRREVKGKDIIINIPPRTSKSKIVSQALLAWVWIKAPQLKMIAVSYSDKLALSNSQYSKDIIKSDQYQELFGDIFQIRKDIDAKERFANDKGGERLSTTIGGTITGFGAEIIVCDDPQDPQTAESEVERERVIKYWTETLFNRLTPLNLGFRVLLQQRLHEDDLSGYLLRKSPNSFHHVCLPAELSKDVKPASLAALYKDGLLDPVRLGRSVLADLKAQGGSRYYAGQYQQTPVPGEGNIIKALWFDIVSASSLKRDTINEPIHFFIDSAYTENTENDPTAILVCYKSGNFLYVLHSQQVWLEFHELIKYLTTFVQSYQYSPQYSKIFIEPKASGKSISSQLRAVTKFNVVEMAPPDKDKVTRANAVTPTLESKRVKLVSGPYIDGFVGELVVFPNGKHDDQLDNLVAAVNELLVQDNPDWIMMGW